jgi:hypothetical protein
VPTSPTIVAVTIVATLAAHSRLRWAGFVALALVILGMALYGLSGAWDCKDACSVAQDSAAVGLVVTLVVAIAVDSLIAISLIVRAVAKRRRQRPAVDGSR